MKVLPSVKVTLQITVEDPEPLAVKLARNCKEGDAVGV